MPPVWCTGFALRGFFVAPHKDLWVNRWVLEHNRLKLHPFSIEIRIFGFQSDYCVIRVGG
jgi:hypothetical protein